MNMNTKNIEPSIIHKLSIMLYEHNTHARRFQMEKEQMNDDNVHNSKMRLISNRTIDAEIYNQLSISEVAALIVGDVDTTEKRDIIMETRGGQLQIIYEFHANYTAYQYPLIFHYGENGYRTNVSHRDSEIFDDKKHNRLTVREWLAFC